MEAPYDIYDYDVFDASGRRVGALNGFWVDDATNQPEFASVKTGWILGRNHLIPIRDARFDHANRGIHVSYDESQIRDAPSFAPDHALTDAEEERVYSHYRLGRNMERSPTGLPGETARRGVATRGAEARAAETRTAEIPLHEERVSVGKRMVEEGGVRLRKVVRSEVREIPVELRREHIEIERVPPGQLKERAAGEAFREQDVTLTERHEEPVIEKTSEVVGGVRATTNVETERQNVRADVRREDIEIDRDVNRAAEEARRRRQP